MIKKPYCAIRGRGDGCPPSLSLSLSPFLSLCLPLSPSSAGERERVCLCPCLCRCLRLLSCLSFSFAFSQAPPLTHVWRRTDGVARRSCRNWCPALARCRLCRHHEEGWGSPARSIGTPPPRASLDPPPPSTPGKGKVVCDHSLPLIIPSTLPSKGVLKSPR